KLRPEMGARVVFRPKGQAEQPDPVAPPAAAILIPVDALVKVRGQTGVFVLERDTVRLRAVELGDQRAGGVVVSSGIEEGETLVLSPPASLSDGDRVRVQS